MYFSPNNSGDKVKPEARISLPPLPPFQNAQCDLIVRDIVRYFLLFPKERSQYLITCYKR